jgi:hypothetical protein
MSAQTAWRITFILGVIIGILLVLSWPGSV